jgi:ornithine carbamoyltransferase
LGIDDFSSKECHQILALAKRVKSGEITNTATGKVGALLFEKPSLRTKVSFLGALAKLGASGMYLGKDEVGLGKRESVEDVGRVLTRMVDVLIVRTFDPVILKGLADSCTIPVINALDDADLLDDATASRRDVVERSSAAKNASNPAGIAELPGFEPGLLLVALMPLASACIRI